MCAGVGVCLWWRGAGVKRESIWRKESGAKPFKNSVLVSAPLVQGQATEISLQSSLFVAI